MSRRPSLPATSGAEEGRNLSFTADHDELWTVEEVAGHLRVSTKTIRRLITAKQLRCERVGTVGPGRKGKILIPRSAINEYRASRATGPEPKLPLPKLQVRRQEVVFDEESLRANLFDRSVVRKYERMPK